MVEMMTNVQQHFLFTLLPLLKNFLLILYSELHAAILTVNHKVYAQLGIRKLFVTGAGDDTNSIQIPMLDHTRDSLCGHRSRVRSPELPDVLKSSGSVTGSTQPRENN
jgi:hypothetical protein